MILRPFNVIHYVIIIVNLVHGELVLPKLLETFQCQARVKVSVCSFKSLHRYVKFNLKLNTKVASCLVLVLVLSETFAEWLFVCISCGC